MRNCSYSVPFSNGSKAVKKMVEVAVDKSLPYLHDVNESMAIFQVRIKPGWFRLIGLPRVVGPMHAMADEVGGKFYASISPECNSY